MSISKLLLLAAVICFILALFISPDFDLQTLGLACFAGSFLT